MLEHQPRLFDCAKPQLPWSAHRKLYGASGKRINARIRCDRCQGAAYADHDGGWSCMVCQAGAGAYAVNCWSCGGAILDPKPSRQHKGYTWPPCPWCQAPQSPEAIWDAMPSAREDRGAARKRRAG